MTERAANSNLRKELNWVLGQFKKRGIEVGAVQINLEDSSFQVFSASASKAGDSELDRWIKDQETNNADEAQ